MAEFQKAGILVFRILDIFGRKYGHFQIVSINSNKGGFQSVEMEPEFRLNKRQLHDVPEYFIH